MESTIKHKLGQLELQDLSGLQPKGGFAGTAEDLNLDIQTRVEKVEGSSLVTDAEITKLSHLDDTTDLQKPVSTAQQAAIDAAVQANLVDSTLINGVTTSSAIPPTGNIHAIGVGAGTYPNWGGMVIPSNNIGTLSRVSGTYSVSLTAFSDVNKINPWTAKAYVSGDQVNHLGKDWVSNAATLSTDVPGVSSKWVDRLLSKANVSDLTSKANTSDLDSDVVIPALIYQDILAENPTVITTYENKWINLDEPLVIGDSYRLKFKMLTQSNGGITGIFTIQLRELSGATVLQYVWNNKTVTVGNQYIETIVAVNASARVLIYCANFGGNIEISFEKTVSLGSGMSVKFDKVLNPLKNKKIVWFGTSIPTGTDTAVNIEDYSGVNKYPSMVASKTGATVYNEALGGTRISTGIISAYNASTDVMGIGNNIQGSFGFYSALTHTLAEKDYIYDNWATIYTKFQDAGSLTATCPKTKEQLRDYSFERKLVRNYLKSTATVSNVNLYVLNHDFNDMFKIAMSGGDTIPTANSATERMYYAGAVNYLIRKIYAADAKARIIMVTHYRKGEPDLDKMYDLVNSVAKYWSIPIVDLANNLQTAQQIQTAGYWDVSKIWHDTGYTFVNNGDGTFTTNDYGPQRTYSLSSYLTNANPHQVVSGEDISFVYPVGTWVRSDHRLNILCPDNVHPHADLTGKSNMIIAKIICDEVKKYL